MLKKLSKFRILSKVVSNTNSDILNKLLVSLFEKT